MTKTNNTNNQQSVSKGTLPKFLAAIKKSGAEASTSNVGGVSYDAVDKTRDQTTPRKLLAAENR